MLRCVFLAACLGISTAAVADEAISSGTAFAISNDGWFLTNAHVVDKCSKIEVKGIGFAETPRIDSINDLAAVKVTANKLLQPLTFRKTPIRLGEDIVAIGYPLSGLLSDSIKVTTGNVNSLAGIANDTRYLQISTPIQPGNSGGPVVDKDGLLVGITSATLSKDAADKMDITAQNVNFAIRSSVAELFLQSQTIPYQSVDKPTQTVSFSTADLAEKITPSVFPVLCYGEPTRSLEFAAPQSQTGVVIPQNPSPTLVEANGYDAIGFDYSTLKNISYDGCRTACAGDSSCNAFTYNKHFNVCFLKRDVVALIRNEDAAAGYSSAKSSQVIFSNFTVRRDMDVAGGDYRRLNKSDFLDCFLACEKDQVCRAFAYVQRRKQCWLKSQLGQSNVRAGVELGIK